jgi:hypothetical protein
MVKKINIQSHCPVCKKKRSLHTGEVISGKGSSLVVYNKCKHCLSASLSVISKSKKAGDSLIAVETLTDLSVEEARNLLNREPLSADDVLTVYQSIAK